MKTTDEFALFAGILLGVLLSLAFYAILSL